jgi:hypothetical protein
MFGLGTAEILILLVTAVVAIGIPAAVVVLVVLIYRQTRK